MTTCEKCGKKVSFLYASKQKKREDIIYCENCMKEFNKKVEQMEEKRKNEDPWKDSFHISPPQKDTLEQTLFRSQMEKKHFKRCYNCAYYFEDIFIFSLGQKEYCPKCIGEIFKERKTPYAFLETVSKYEVGNRIINSKTITLISLSKKNSLISKSNTKSTGSLPPGLIEMDINAQIEHSKIYEKLLKEKQNNKDNNEH